MKVVCVSQTEQALLYWQQLDLNYLVDKLSADSYPLPRWQPKQAQEGLVLYMRFLKLCMLYPGEALVPTKDMDEFWHMHILHTKSYMNDCQNLFGRYLHHTPSDEHAVSELSDGFNRMLQLYKHCFGDSVRVLQRGNGYIPTVV